MNLSPVSSGNVPENITLPKENNQGKLWHVYSTDGQATSSKIHQTKSLAFLPILGFIIFVICSLLKMYKWSRDSARWKARGGGEFGGEAEVNYGIIKAGDKDFCQIDILSDGTSVYDTVNSLRFFSNGYATQMSESYPYHDTVTSYKCLLMQKADGSPYDSVKSYKAFVQKAAQNKDLAVEVKLLENHPVRSVSKDGQFLQFENKRSKRRRASGDLSAAKKRSVSHPSSRWVTNPVCSLPTVSRTYSFSGVSGEDNLQAFRVNRKLSATKKKKMPHPSSSGKMLTFPGSSCHSAPCACSCNGAVNIPKRRRHFSADSVRHLKKATVNKVSNNNKYLYEGDLTNSFNMAAGIKMIMETKPGSVQVTESSSKNPNTSHSCGVAVPSGTLVAGPDLDIQIKKHIPLSIVSNGHILGSDVLVSLNSGSEIIETSAKQSLSQTKTLISHAREEFFKNKLNSAFSLKPKDTIHSYHSGTVAGNKDSKNFTRGKIAPACCSQISNCENQSMCLEDRINLNLQCIHWPSVGSPTKSVCAKRKRKQQSSNMVETNTSENMNDGVSEPATKSNLYTVQRFHVTYVNAKISSRIYDGTKSS